MYWGASIWQVGGGDEKYDGGIQRSCSIDQIEWSVYCQWIQFGI